LTEGPSIRKTEGAKGRVSILYSPLTKGGRGLLKIFRKSLRITKNDFINRHQYKRAQELHIRILFHNNFLIILRASKLNLHESENLPLPLPSKYGRTKEGDKTSLCQREVWRDFINNVVSIMRLFITTEKSRILRGATK